MSRSVPALRVVDSTGRATSHLRVGDVVRTGNNLYPRFEIIALVSGRAWIRDIQYGHDHVVSMEGLHAIG